MYGTLFATTGSASYGTFATGNRCTSQPGRGRPHCWSSEKNSNFSCTRLLRSGSFATKSAASRGTSLGGPCTPEERSLRYFSIFSRSRRARDGTEARNETASPTSAAILDVRAPGSFAGSPRLANARSRPVRSSTWRHPLRRPSPSARRSVRPHRALPRPEPALSLNVPRPRRPTA